MQVMLVDDDKYSLNALSQSLQILGIECSPYLSSVQALDAFARSSDDFDLIITDYTMPMIDGMAFMRQAKRIKQGVPVILVSGHYLSNEVWSTAQQHGVPIFRKPIDLREILNLVQRVEANLKNRVENDADY